MCKIVLHEKFFDKRTLNVRKLIDFLEEDLLNFKSFPTDYFYSIVYIFDNEEFWATPSLWKILHMLTSEELTASQFLEVSETLTKRFPCYSDNMLCDMSSDFICRVCSIDDAFRLLNLISEADENKFRNQAVIVGVNVIRHRDDFNESFNAQLDGILSKLT